MHESTLADFAPKRILALCGEPHRALATLIEPVEGIYRLVGWQIMPLCAQTGPDDCPVALAQAVTRLGNQLGISLWDADQNRPRAQSSAPALADGVGHVTAVADLLPPLRVWMAGLTAAESLAAGAEALASALCHLVAVYRPSPYRNSNALAKELQAVRPDVALVVGGYEHQAEQGQERVLALSHQVTDAIAQLPAKSRPLFCFAGNSWTTNEVLAYWQEQAAGSTAKVVANVLGPGRRSAMALHSTLGQYYWQHSLDVPAMRQIAAWVHQPAELRSSQWAFVQAVRLWTDFQGLPELHGLYAGADRWLHVWASQEHGEVRVCFVRPKEDPSFLADWPPLRLVSGEWPAQWPRPSTYWWDPLGFVPLVVTVGQVAPEAAVQVLAADLLDNNTQPPTS